MSMMAKQMTRSNRVRIVAVVALLGALVGMGQLVGAQQPAGGRGAPPPPPTPRASAPMDYEGYWVSVVTEDWRWRMVTPPKGDVASVPVNAAGRKAAASWDLAQDKANGNECRAFGAAGLMRLPLRMRITWQDDTTLKIETDAGRQTRLLRFGSGPPATTASSLQGYSVAEWSRQRQTRGFGGVGGGAVSPAGGHLQVTTTYLQPGYLRKNGVPYSDRTVLTEYFVRHPQPAPDWLTITSVVEDPVYLAEPFITSTEFKKEPDASKWRPTGCEIDPPLE